MNQLNDPKIRTIDYAILLFILIIAVFLRILKLDSSLWYDEIITVVDFVRLPIEALVTNPSSFNNHPFYSLQANVSVLLFDENTWSVRLPAVFFGIASIAAMWRLAYSATGVLQAPHYCPVNCAIVSSCLVFPERSRLHRTNVLVCRLRYCVD